MRFQASFLLASMIASGSAYAESNAVKTGPAPEWVTPSEALAVPVNATGAAFLRNQEALIHLDSQGHEQYVGYRIKILQSNALEVGNISISWDPSAGAPTVHAIKIYRGTEVIDVLKTTSFEVLRREGQLEAAKLDGVLTAILRVTDLRVGDELDVSYTIRVNDPTLKSHDSGLLVLGLSPAPGRHHLQLSWDKNRKPNLQMTPDIVALVKTRDQAVDFQLDNPSSVSPPKDAPQRFQWLRTIEYSSFANWGEVSSRLAPLFSSAAKISTGSLLKQEANKIASSNPTMLGKASDALKLVQQNIRYVYIGLDRGNLTPSPADETWQRRYGDCKAKTVLLLALLAEMGIEAEPVLVDNRGIDDGLNERLPSPRLFDHVIVRAHIDGKWYWLDGTMPPDIVPSLTPTLPYRWVLPLTEQGSPLQRIEWQVTNTPDELRLVDIDARTGFDKPANVISTSILRGISGLQQNIQFSPVTSDQLTNFFRQQLVGGDWETIENVKWRYDVKAQASILTISGTWKLDWENDGDGSRSLALPGGGFSPPERRGRAADQNQNLPYYNKPEYNCYVTTVRIPTSTKYGQWASKPGFDTRIFGRNYYRAFSLKGGAIRMIRGMRVERQEVEANSARLDNERIPKFDNSKGYIFFDPAGHSKPIASSGDVPTTDEIDWTGDDVPCLSQAAKNSIPKVIN